MLEELKERREYINNPRKAINIHSIRYYTHPECYMISDGVKRPSIMVIDRNLSIKPSYFTFYDIDEKGGVVFGHVPNGIDTWKKAESWLNENLSELKQS